MAELDFNGKELEELTTTVRQGATAIVEAWELLSKIGARIGRDWEPDDDGQSVSDIMELFASSMTTAEAITTAAVKEAFSRIQDWQPVAMPGGS